MGTRSMLGDPLGTVVGSGHATTLLEAAEALAQAAIGALRVVRRHRPVGIPSERDLVRRWPTT